MIAELALASEEVLLQTNSPFSMYPEMWVSMAILSVVWKQIRKCKVSWYEIKHCWKKNQNVKETNDLVAVNNTIY